MRVGIVGNLTRDVIRPQGIVQMGGTAYYSGVTASRLGYKVCLLSKVGVDYERDWLERLENEDIELILQYSKESTVFENTYESGSRRQRLTGDAGRIEWNERFDGCDIVHVGPVFDEVSPNLMEMLDCDLISLDVQGFIRKRRKNNSIAHCKWKNMRKYLSKVNVIHASLDEVEYIDYLKRGSLIGFDLLKLGPKVVVFTNRAHGSYVFHEDDCQYVPAYRVREFYPTGAGDVYSIAFLIKYVETGNPRLSAYFASAAASLLVERGIEGIVNREVVEERMKRLIR